MTIRKEVVMRRISLVTVLCLALAVPALAKEKMKPVPKASGLAATNDAALQNAALKGLAEGNGRFQSKSSKQVAQQEGKEKNQMPKVMVLACSDSRVPPEVVFDQVRGVLYSNRVLGNVVDEMTVGSLEYGARIMRIPVLVVLGHSNCSAVKMAIEETENPTKDLFLNMEALMTKLKESVVQAKGIIKERGMKPESLMDEAVKENVRNTIRRILELSPAMWQLQHQGKLKIVGAVYSLETGKVEWLDR